MRSRHRPRFLRVINKIALREMVRVFADNFDRFLVCAHGAVGAETKELSANDVVRLEREFWIDRKTRVREIVLDADREMIFRRSFIEIIENGFHHGRREFFRGQAVTAAHHPSVAPALLIKRVYAIEIERLASAPRLLRPVEHRDAAHRHRQHFYESLSVERPVEPDLQHAHLLIL